MASGTTPCSMDVPPMFTTLCATTEKWEVRHVWVHSPPKATEDRCDAAGDPDGNFRPDMLRRSDRTFRPAAPNWWRNSVGLGD